MIPISILLTFYLFFLSGGIAMIAFLPAWVQTIAQFIPTHYGVHALQMAIFYSSSDRFVRELLVMLATTALTLLLGVWSVRRESM